MSKARTGVPSVNFSALAKIQRHGKHVEKLWALLGRRGFADLLTEAAWAIETLPGANHGALNIKLTDDQKKRMLPLLAAFDFFRASYLPPGEYDEVHVTGAKFKGMVARVVDFKERYLDKNERTESNANKRYKFGRITCQVGMRPRQVAQTSRTGEPNPMDGTIEEILGGLTQKVLDHPWMAEEQLKLNDPRPTASKVDDQDLWWGPVDTECKLMVLAWLIAYDGNIRVRKPEEIEEEQMFPQVPARTFKSITLVLPDGPDASNPFEGGTEVLVLNAPAVERPQGDPRPTTFSATGYWLSEYTPVFGARLVTISSPMHWYRVTRDFEARMHQDRPDIEVFCISRGTAKPMDGFNQALGEVAHLLALAFDETLELLPEKAAEELKKEFAEKRAYFREQLALAA